MQILIDHDYNALEVCLANNLVAQENIYQFIIDTDRCNCHDSVLIEVAKQNKIELDSKRRKEIIKQLKEGLIHMSEISDETLQKVQAIVDNGVNEGHDDDTILMAMMQNAGIKFKQALPLLTKAMEKGGYRASNNTVKESGRQLLVDSEFEPEIYDDIIKAVSHILESIEGSNEAQALGVVRNYCKEFEFALPKKPRAVKVTIDDKITNLIMKNPGMSNDDLSEVLIEQGYEKKVAKFVKLLEFGRQFATAYSSLAVEEANEETEAA